ncbi:MAG: bifunctional glutamate N-acetyltransferase/amino-acid acetyltransferase ArgJ, partial [Chloroflexi bacterium]|nr:bifunctional glutamate N-acetyltransferase/amino-acid acetyltransferase ArgJ [Chloroflexota bacterium]
KSPNAAAPDRGASTGAAGSFDAGGRDDLALLVADAPCAVAGLFTRSAVVGEALAWTREQVARGRTRAVVVNSGNANCCTGDQGAADARRMAELAAAQLGVAAEDVLVGSTGVIGRLLPMDRVTAGIAALRPAAGGGDAFARAIMTTDTHPKQSAVRVAAGGRTYVVGGAAKGSGMIHPDLATMFGFLTTDAPADPAWLRATLRAVCDRSFNMVDVDMDTSTCDMVLALASGAAGGEPVAAGHPAAAALAAAFEAVAVQLARAVARDGEGARTLIEVVVEGAASEADARVAARTISASPLVKTAVTGRDPNWGRVMMAAGRSGAAMDPRRASVWIGEHCAFERGQPTAVELRLIAQAMVADEVRIRVDLAAGDASATAWGCDLTADYVRINAEYTT